MKTLTRIAFLLSSGTVAATALSACGSSAPLFTSDGRPTQQLQCSATAAGDCAERASSQCGGKSYDVLQRETSGSTATIVIACKAS